MNANVFQFPLFGEFAYNFQYISYQPLELQHSFMFWLIFFFVITLDLVGETEWFIPGDRNSLYQSRFRKVLKS